MKKAKDLIVNRIFKKKKVWIPLLIFFLIIIPILLPKNNSKNIVTDKATSGKLEQTILATGQVVSSTDLNLSFNSSGIVKEIKVEVGDKVKAGQVLANLEQGTVLANLTSARGTLAAANAKLKKVMEGTDVALAKIAIDSAKVNYENTKNIQDTLVKNAYNNFLNSNPEAIPKDGESDYIAPIISGTYNLGQEGKLYLSLYESSGGTSFELSGLTTGTGLVNSITAQPIGNSGLYITFPEESTNNSDWVIEIPNKKAVDYLTNYNAYQSALKAKQSAIDQAQALVDQRQVEYNSKLTSSTGSDIDIAQAEVLSASGQVEQALALYNDTQIKAPTDGTITSVDIKIGELAQAQKEAIILQDVSNIYLEANINEANISNLKVGMPIDITYDAFGGEQIFKGQVTKIDPASTIISGVVNYKVTASIEQTEGLRPGMTANMTIKVLEKDNVLAIQKRAIIVKEDKSQVIRLVTKTKTKKYKEVPITTGILGDGGMVEILNGLQEGDEYVVLIKTK